MHSPNIIAFDDRWEKLLGKWAPPCSGNATISPATAQRVHYLRTTWLPYKWQWAKPFTDHIRHFEQLSTSRVEGAHSALKWYLQVSIGDLNTVVDSIRLLLIAQHTEHIISFAQAGTQVPHEAKSSPFWYILHCVATRYRCDSEGWLIVYLQRASGAIYSPAG